MIIPKETILKGLKVYSYMAVVLELKPMLEAKKRQVLAMRKWKVSPYAEKRGILEITDPKLDYLIADIDQYDQGTGEFAAYLSEVERAVSILGLPYGVNSVLHAESALREAKRELFNSVMLMPGMPGLTYEQLTTGLTKDYEAFFDLSLRMIAPYIAAMNKDERERFQNKIFKNYAPIKLIP